MIEDNDDVEVIVTEGNVEIESGDLFDVPTAARTLPGMDPVDSAAAATSWEQAEAEPEIQIDRRSPLRRSLEARSPRWRMHAGIGAVSVLVVVLIGVVYRTPHTVPLEEPASIPGETAVPRPEAVVPRPEAVVPPPEAVVHRPEAAVRPAKERAPVPETPMPPPQRSGRERLLAIESALAAGRRGFARVELGRLLLDTDLLPVPEREDTRAQAELLVARLLQDVADAARRSPR